MCAPVIEGLGGPVVAMFKGDKKSAVVCTYHERIHFGVGWRACPLTTEVKENRSVISVEKLIVHPVPLLIRLLVVWCGIKMIDVVGEAFLTEVRHLHCFELLVCDCPSAETKGQSDSHGRSFHII